MSVRTASNTELEGPLAVSWPIDAVFFPFKGMIGGDVAKVRNGFRKLGLIGERLLIMCNSSPSHHLNVV